MFFWEPSTLPFSRRGRVPSRFLVVSLLLSWLTLIDYDTKSPHLHHQKPSHQPARRSCWSIFLRGNMLREAQLPCRRQLEVKYSEKEKDMQKEALLAGDGLALAQNLKSAANVRSCWCDQF